MKLSYSSVSTYLNCPRAYQFSYVDWLPTLPKPALSFGQSIHAALADFYREIKEMEKINKFSSQPSSPTNNLSLPLFTPPPFKRLLHYYWLNWSSEGYQSKEQEKNKYIEGKQILQTYYEENKHSLKAPLAIEERFEIPFDGFLLTGVIDRIDETPEGLEIIDYKTGQSVPDEEELRADLQLPIYHLAAEKKWNSRPHRLTLYFLNPSSKKNPDEKPRYRYSFSLEDDEVKKVEETLYETLKAIKNDLKEKEEKNKDFEARPNKFCNWCDFKIICPEKSGRSQEEINRLMSQFKKYKTLKKEREKIEKELRELEKELSG